ncbi:MAG: diaminopimelate decarboxylase, partial [Planctomycetes bacterium]|nr:diaminopimelate decarboxylase [Planctomycetota bacterium]
MSVDIHQLIADYGSPLYVYDLELVRERARTLKQAIQYDNTEFHYAIKANPCPAVVRCLQAEGYGIDAVSPGEVALALKLGFDPKQILYTENNMTDAEMHDALGKDVLINCGSLDRLQRCGDAGAKRAAVRFNPDVGAGAHEKIYTAGPLTKFGVYYNQVDQVRAIEENTGCKVVGCHMHIGSGILDADIYLQAMTVILDVAKQLPHLEFINFGGGLGIPYGANDQSIDLEKLGSAAGRLMTEFCEAYGRPLQLRLEPGRFLVC